MDDIFQDEYDSFLRVRINEANILCSFKERKKVCLASMTRKFFRAKVINSWFLEYLAHEEKVPRSHSIGKSRMPIKFIFYLTLSYLCERLNLISLGFMLNTFYLPLEKLSHWILEWGEFFFCCIVHCVRGEVYNQSLLETLEFFRHSVCSR